MEKLFESALPLSYVSQRNNRWIYAIIFNIYPAVCRIRPVVADMCGYKEKNHLFI